ncbi:hypothetical protein [Halalkalicoccus subterraneus]|uniref:hypothetical protein n=1 Tax=Halalkalicoccus subterraneus TaxID=2675002 RepID=UPI0013CE85E7|nr:hypothetical protein [Halalkalicoccus subterraneus]
MSIILPLTKGFYRERSRHRRRRIHRESPCRRARHGARRRHRRDDHDRDLARTVRSVANSNSEIVHIEGRTGDIDRSHADIGKARERLDYEPTVGLDEGLRTVVADHVVS